MLTQAEVTAKLIALGVARYYAERGTGAVHWVNFAAAKVATGRAHAILRLEPSGRYSLASVLADDEVPFPRVAAWDDGATKGRGKPGEVFERANAVAARNEGDFVAELDGFLCLISDFQSLVPAKQRRRLP
ncbi:MAG: hypothetical protein EP330_23365 [Deltaproteobacteria bacterium]|nr:MAG: hypothetical protein EP330_23365 [Deltaproteobacteria bacterium]